MDNRWVIGARPPTLAASVAPVVVGTAAAAGAGDVVLWRAVAALVVALSVQVGTNYVNDAADGERGTDSHRVGPVRLVASGLATASEVKRAAVAAFGVAAVAGLALTFAVGPELIPVGAASIAAGWAYTAGPRPYGYAGLGEVFVFVFFGLVATVGSAYVHLDAITALAVLAAVPVGLLSTALIVVNNLRDIDTDRLVGKNTLAVRWGAPRTRRLYLRLVSGALLLTLPLAVIRPGALVALAATAAAWRPAQQIVGRVEGRALISVLAGTARLGAVHGLLLGAGLWLSA
ncbi:MAG TPA: 1,4-dihydroxy-2-naphthoate polyprenyltransferase [Acidimicrobiales bacterium]